MPYILAMKPMGVLEWLRTGTCVVCMCVYVHLQHVYSDDKVMCSMLCTYMGQFCVCMSDACSFVYQCT